MHFTLDRLIIDHLTDSNTAHLATNDAFVPTNAHRRVMKADGKLAGQVSAFTKYRGLQSHSITQHTKTQF